MPAAPLPADDAARLASLIDCCLLDTVPEPEFDELANMAARLCYAPYAAISLIDLDRQWFKASVGVGVKQTPRSAAFCGYTILQDEMMVVPDAREDPRLRDNPLVTGPPHLRFYAGVPLRLSDGCAVGALCVINTMPYNLPTQQRRDLLVLGRAVLCEIELRRMRVLADRERQGEASEAA